MENKNYLRELVKTNRKGKVVREIVERNYKTTLIQFFRSNPNPSEDDVNKFVSDVLKIDQITARETIYSLLSTYLQVGKHRNEPDSKYDSEELRKGIEVEKEHTDDPSISKEIAKDHLSEISDYYTRLKKMESEAGVD